MTRRAQQIVIQQPYQISIRAVPLPPLGDRDVLVKTWASAISAGTEMLFYRGEVPSDMSVDTSIDGLTQQVTYPLHYGYAAVGTIVDVGAAVDPCRLGQRVFAFQPHSSFFASQLDFLHPIPSQVSWEQALFLPNMETAVNLIMDARPVIGERAVVFGQGIVGLLSLFLLRQIPLDSLSVVDAMPQRRRLATRWHADAVYTPAEWEQDAPKDADLMLEVSGNPAALAAALRHAPYGARVVIGSWYGTKQAALDLGGSFHRNRVNVMSSQVSTIAPRWQARWDKKRRFAVAWHHLANLPVDDLITHRLSATRAPEAFSILHEEPEKALQVILIYSDDTGD